MRRTAGLTLAAALALAMLTSTPSAVATGNTTGNPTVHAAGTATGSRFTPSAPRRVLDTRTGVGPVGAGRTITVDLSAAVPASATAVVVNVTGTAPTTSTFVTAYAAGTARPIVSNLNLRAGETRANLVTVAVGADRDIVLYNKNGSVHLIADLVGHYAPDGQNTFLPQPVRRLLDTRVTFQGRPAGKVGPGGTVAIDLTDRLPASVTAVTLNLTATGGTTSTFVTVWPSGTPRPATSNLNAMTGLGTTNQVVVAIGADRKVNLYNKNGSTHLAVDLTGDYSPGTGGLFTTVPPRRVLDTRIGPPIGPGAAVNVDVTALVATGTVGVVMNLTGTEPTANTWASAWTRSTTAEVPEAPTLHLVTGQTAATLMTVGLEDGDRVALRTNPAGGTVHLVADLFGYFAPAPSA